MRKLSMVLTLLVAFGVLMLCTTSSEAVHRGAGDLTCGACHTMHNSQGGTKIVSAATTGGLVLLRDSVTTRGDIPKFCLSCHAESGDQAGTVQQPKNITAPKVLRTSFSWDMTQSWMTIGAGGDFRWVLNTSTFAVNTEDDNSALGYGHSVGATVNVTAPGGGPTITTANGFSCTNCHDPHGAPDNAVSTNGINRFRNLKVAPNGGTGVTLTSFAAVGSSSDTASDWTGVGSGSAADHVWPFMEAACNGTPDNCNRYGGGPNDTQDGISGWCSQCHPDWHEDSTNGANNKSGNDWRRHPVNNPMVEAGSTTSGANVVIVDWAHYAGATPGVGYDLPLAEPDDALTTDVYGDDDQDRVFCLSCHFAHGGPYLDALRWEHLVTVASGEMTAKGIPSNRGCQNCHNK